MSLQEYPYQRELKTILRFGALVNSSLHIESVLDYAMQWAEEFMDAEASSVYELDDESGELVVRIARGEKRETVSRIVLKVGEGIAGAVVQTGEPMIVQDVRTEKRFSDKFDRITGFKTKSTICVPLMRRNKAVGALQVLNKRDDRPFTANDLELLMGIAQQVAVALENARLYHRLQERFEMTARELMETQEKLIRTERLAAVGHLVQGVAHEIRNPIMTIGGFAQRMRKETGKDEKLNRYIDIIMDESARLEKLVQQVRRFAEVQEAHLVLESPERVVREVLKGFEAAAGSQGVTLTSEIEEPVPVLLMDAPQLETALSNILENALESMPDGGFLRVAVSTQERHLLIVVRDTGCGIAPEDMESIYDPFVTSKTRGAGLGMTMVHQIVMNHKGDIAVNSEFGKGTVVTVRFPVQSGLEMEGRGDEKER
ncbi:MAG: GAF domain-containing protein [Deltaproteobacteria bacterium]|nr:GAF domain-containing protein [Deltaproteobacteria bacterium]